MDEAEHRSSYLWSGPSYSTIGLEGEGPYTAGK